MDKYLDQLIKTIQGFTKAQNLGTPTKPSNFLEHMEVWDKWRVSDKINIAAYTDITSDHIPPEQFLTDQQIGDLYIALLDLLKTFRIYISMPITVPLRYKYTMVRDAWFTFELGPTAGNFIEDFCSGESEMCLLGEYCCCQDQDEQSEQSDTIDHFYILDENKKYPLVDFDETGGEEELDYELMWQSYQPLDLVKSKYIPQLAQDLKDAAFALHPKGHLNIFEEVEGVELNTLNFKPIFSLFQKDSKDFPMWADLNFYEADSISKTLMEIFDKEFFNEQMPYVDCFLRYKVLIEFLAKEVAFIDIDTYLIKPLTEEELEIEREKERQINERFLKDIDPFKGNQPDTDSLGMSDEDLPF